MGMPHHAKEFEMLEYFGCLDAWMLGCLDAWILDAWMLGWMLGCLNVFYDRLNATVVKSFPNNVNCCDFESRFTSHERTPF